MDSLELNWEQLLEQKCKDGSFLTSPSSTAYALVHTTDENCLRYLTNIVHKFNGGVPNIYPLGTYERVWAVDSLRRLGICRYFQPQISDLCIRSIEKSWLEKGIGTTRNSNVPDIDDTCMAFRLLRLYGHHVSADVFSNFKKGNEFFCFAGQSDEGVTVIYNLYRASQVLFPGDTILEDARQFAYKLLSDKNDANELSDKWIISKDLAGEIEYGLHVPWYPSLPRVETGYELDQYGGEDDVWIAKVLYRYLEVAKQDYNSCQALHRCEWEAFQRWYKDFELGDLGVSKEALLQAYFVATANIFEPGRSKERLAWAKTCVLVDIISSFSHHEATSSDAFVHEFLNKHKIFGHINTTTLDTEVVAKRLVRILLTPLNYMSLDAHGNEIGQDLLDIRMHWKDWLGTWRECGEKHACEAELLVRTMILTSGHSSLSQEIFTHPHYHSLVSLTNLVCYKLRLYCKHKVHEGNGNYSANAPSCMTTPEIESEMQQLVLDNSMNHIDPQIKHMFLAVAKSFYYTAFFPTSMINLHSSKVLFQNVD